jgi:hypothetical protein
VTAASLPEGTIARWADLSSRRTAGPTQQRTEQLTPPRVFQPRCHPARRCSADAANGAPDAILLSSLGTPADPRPTARIDR